MTSVTTLFNQLFTLISGFVFPDTPTSTSLLAAFGVLFPLIVVALSFLFRLVRGSGS